MMDGRPCALRGGSPCRAGGLCSGGRDLEPPELLWFEPALGICSWQPVSAMLSKVAMMSSTPEVSSPGSSGASCCSSFRPLPKI